ncbi:MAG TPA: carbohydrate kinase family protein [Candidatus Thermoplasmatota archaeon]|nr:carbohydrate kinase family protein [Candidatus Thermoplasmatota archaeon]
MTRHEAPFLAVCGHTNLDVLMRVKDLPQAGRSTPVLERTTARGGNGANIAIHAAGLGVPVRLWSRVGGDFPADWRADMERAGVDLRCLVVEPRTPTPTCYIFTDLLDRQAFAVDQGPMAAMGEHPPPEELLDGMPRGAWLHLATGDPLAYAHIADTAVRRGIRVALDPGQEMSFRYTLRELEGLLSFSDVLFVNEAELRVACEILGLTMAEDLLRFVDAVVVTRGAKGASLYRVGAKALHSNAFPVDRALDPTGAGDAFRSGWYAGLQAGASWEEALRWAQAAGASKVRHPGSQTVVLSRRDVESFLHAA